MIQLQGVQKTYQPPGSGSVHALRDVSLRIEPGQSVAIVGSSGSGKSTLMNLLGLLDTPTDGTYLLDGRDVARTSEVERARLRNRNIGFVFQAFHLMARLSALENVELPLLYSDRRDIRGLARAALEAVGLADRARHKPSELSGGQQQRVAIARAMVNAPELLLADEPTGNLDPHSALEIMAIFQRLQEAGRTVLVVTHDRQIAQHCQRILRLEDGRIVADEAVDPQREVAS
jgi:putative ABC transport system ATP-binding protein